MGTSVFEIDKNESEKPFHTIDNHEPRPANHLVFSQTHGKQNEIAI